MTITLPFDQWHSDWYTKDDKYNRLFITCQLKHLAAIYKIYGFLYLSTVYTTFKLKWNPHDENLCWILADGDELDIIIWYTFDNKIEKLRMGEW